MLEGWYEVSGLTSPSELWVYPTGPSRPEYGFWRTPEGLDIDVLIGDGEFDRVPEPFWFERDPNCRSEKKANVLWAGDMKVVSQEFIDGLTKLGVGGFRALPVEVRTKRWGTMTDEYFLFLEDMTGTEEVRGHPGAIGRCSSMLMSPRVRKGLKDLGIGRFRAAKYVEAE